MSTKYPQPNADWPRVSFDAPRTLANQFRQRAQEDVPKRGGKVNLSGTAALGLWVALPREARLSMLRWASQVEEDASIAENPEHALQAFAAILQTMISKRSTVRKRPPPQAEEVDESQWFVDRILTPELLAPKKVINKNSTAKAAG